MSEPPAEVTIRPALAADLGALGAIEVAAGERFRTVGMDDIADDGPYELDVYRAAFDDGRLWVAEIGAEPVGYAFALDLDVRAHLEQISVRPEWSGWGIGVALVEAVADWARSRGASALTLSTFEHVAWNAPWYARRGFVVVPDDELDERLRGIRSHEAAVGLDVSVRVIMRRELDGTRRGTDG